MVPPQNQKSGTDLLTGIAHISMRLSNQGISEADVVAMIAARLVDRGIVDSISEEFGAYLEELADDAETLSLDVANLLSSKDFQLLDEAGYFIG